MVTKFALTFVVVVMFTVCCGQDNPTPCPNDRWTVVGDDSLCVRFVDNFRLPAGWASGFCASRGGSLLRFSNYDSLTQFSALATTRKVDGWWSDLNDIGQPGTWTWGGTEKVTPGALAWATEPTDSHHAENCVSIDTTGSLSDDDCTQRLGIVCQYTPTTVGQCAGGYQAAGPTCYYISPLNDPEETVSWTGARNSCLHLEPAEGVVANLASFNTSDQLQGLQTLVQTAGTVGKRWTGLNDRTTEREWDWADGTRVSDTTFINSQWKKYPDKGTGHSCGLVHGNGQMEEANCTDRHHFACQRTINPDAFVAMNGLGCPSPWIRGGRKCYYFNRRRSLTRNRAKSFCSSIQGRLLKIENADERDWVVQQTISGFMFNMWTGLKRASDGSSTWVWDDGSAADSTLYSWNQQPSNPVIYQADCAFINPRGKYNDASCFMPLSFICEMDTEDNPCPSTWLSTDEDGNDFTTCYYISSNATDGKASWREAQGRCSDLAGLPEAHLVAITSQDELDYLVSLMSGRNDSGYWTDLTDIMLEGVWSFSQQYEGTPPPIPWDSEPNNNAGDENCAVLFVDGKYNDVSCTRPAHVICERPAASLNGPPSSSIAQNASVRLSASLVVFLPIIVSLLRHGFFI